jgi:hypothetical protein
VVLEDLGAPRLEGASERLDLLDVVVRAADDGLVDERRSVVGVVGEVDVAQGLLLLNRT